MYWVFLVSETIQIWELAVIPKTYLNFAIYILVRDTDNKYTSEYRIY